MATKFEILGVAIKRGCHITTSYILATAVSQPPFPLPLQIQQRIQRKVKHQEDITTGTMVRERTTPSSAPRFPPRIPILPRLSPTSSTTTASSSPTPKPIKKWVPPVVEKTITLHPKAKERPPASEDDTTDQLIDDLLESGEEDSSESTLTTPKASRHPPIPPHQTSLDVDGNMSPPKLLALTQRRLQVLRKKHERRAAAYNEFLEREKEQLLLPTPKFPDVDLADNEWGEWLVRGREAGLEPLKRAIEREERVLETCKMLMDGDETGLMEGEAWAAEMEGVDGE